MWHGGLGEGNCTLQYNYCNSYLKNNHCLYFVAPLVENVFPVFKNDTHHIIAYDCSVNTFKGKWTNSLRLITGKKHPRLCVYLEQFDTSMVGPSQFLPPHRGAGLSQDLERHRHELTPSTPSLLLQGCQGAQGPKPPLVVWFRSWQRADINRLIEAVWFWGRGAEVVRSEGLVVLPDNWKMDGKCVFFRGTYSNHLSKVIQHLWL